MTVGIQLESDSNLVSNYHLYPGLHTFALLEGLDASCSSIDCPNSWDQPLSPAFHLKSPVEIYRLPIDQVRYSCQPLCRHFLWRQWFNCTKSFCVSQQNIHRTLGLPYLTFTPEADRLPSSVNDLRGKIVSSLAWEVDWSEEQRGTEASLGVAIFNNLPQTTAIPPQPHLARYLPDASQSIAFNLSSAQCFVSRLGGRPFGMIHRHAYSSSKSNGRQSYLKGLYAMNRTTG